MNKIILVNDKKVEVKKLRLSQYVEVLEAVEQIPAILSDFPNKDESELLAMLPKLIAKALPEVIKILVIATPCTEDEVEEAGLDGATALLLAVIEVNQIGRVAKNFQQMIKQNSPQGSGTTKPLTSPPVSTDGASPQSTNSTQTNSGG